VLAATVLDESATPLMQFSRAQKLGVLFGNEAQGLDADVVALCDHRITIPMSLGTDSLNVSVAAGIFLYELTKAAV
jgi:tRNA G18 (ribose-2'-O)-methylase SpoU